MEVNRRSPAKSVLPPNHPHRIPHKSYEIDDPIGRVNAYNEEGLGNQTGE